MSGAVLAATTAGAIGILAGVAGCTLLECSVGLGVVLPAETVVVSAGAAAANGVLPLWAVFVVALVFGAAGDNIGFAIGRRWGGRLVERYGPRVGLTPARARRADDLVARWGVLAVAGGRFLPAVRILVMPAAGATGLPWRRFAVADAAGVAGWAALHVGIGYLVGLGFDRVSGRGLVLALAAAAVALAAWLIVRHRRRPGGTAAAGGTRGTRGEEEAPMARPLEDTTDGHVERPGV